MNLKNIIVKTYFIIMIIYSGAEAQSSFGLNGYWNNSATTGTLLNSFEANPDNYSLVKDWGMNISYGAEFTDQIYSNLFLISLIKTIDASTITARYTPGFQKEFFFNNGERIIFEDSTSQSLNSNFNYKELFGLGYSYKVNDQISAGISLRYFNQEFNKETVFPVFSDTLYLQRENLNENSNFWKADIGITFFPLKNFKLKAASINLFNFGKSSLSDEFKDYEMKTEIAALFGFEYNPFNNFNVNFFYETDNSFLAGLNKIFNFNSWKLGAGITTFHNELQTPFFAGIVPSIFYSNDLFGVTLSGIKYFSDRNQQRSLTNFIENGIDNIINNRFSYDKVVLTLTFTLNTLTERYAKFVDVEINNNIYPALSEKYIDEPFAKAKIVNTSDEIIEVKPSSKIEGINSEIIQSPNLFVRPGDTVTVSFYTVVPENISLEKAEISYADFYLTALNKDPDDHIQKPILLNSSNAWDADVSNLKFFIKHSINYSMSYAKEILSNYKTELDTINYSLITFNKSKILFNNFVKELVYTSDPKITGEYVQYPEETLKIKGGDCDDLSVAFSSILESVGIKTALVDFKNKEEIRHVNLLVNTELNPHQATLITNNDSKYIVRKNESGKDKIWIPIEITSLTNFETAWKIGAEKFNREAIDEMGIVKGDVEIIEVN